MNKQEVYQFLKDNNIQYEVTEHPAVYNMEEMDNLHLPYPYSAKNLFVRDDKKANYYLITVKEEKRVNLKEFRKQNGTRNLSFASENDLIDILRLVPGSVTPFGLLNDKEQKVKFYIDEDLLSGDGMIGIHPNENTATVWLKTEDLIKILKENGNEINIVKI
mgnify:FL=1